MELKAISPKAVDRALELAHRYRLLNEPDQAASICRDVLAVDADNQGALRTLLLALTDQFGGRQGINLQHAEEVARRLVEHYDRVYHLGIVYERWGRCKLGDGTPGHVAAEWLHRAMEFYAEAERLSPSGNDDAILRWNTCVRLLQSNPALRQESQAHEMHMGD
jgi:hypothetical protein